MAWMGHGDFGVDIFFVLSGFLIAFILLKEHAKHGSVDVCNFYRSRFLRIWPAMFIYAIIEAPLKVALIGVDYELAFG